MIDFNGVGIAPAGISYAGYGTPSSTTISNSTLLKKELGSYGNVRLIDPITKDYKFNSDGFVVGGDDVQQMVYLALLTVRNSSCLNGFGQSFTNIKVIGQQYKSLVVQEVEFALKKLIDTKKIKLLSVNVNKIGNNAAKIDIRWLNISKNSEESTIV